MLRRIVHNLKTQDWITVALEILIVAIGIFLALQVDNWNESRKDRIDEQRFLSRLHDDIELAEHLSNRVRGRRLAVLADLMDASDVIFGRVDRPELTDDQCNSIGASHYFNVPISDLPSLSELISTGRMAIIRDADLRSALVGLQQIREALQFLINIQIVGTHDLASAYPDLFQLESYFDGHEAWSRGRCNLDGMRTEQRFLNNLSTNIDRYDAYIRDGLAPWSEQIETVHELVDDALEIKHEREIDAQPDC